MRKIMLKCGLSLGDIVMLTAAVRDLHLCHPGAFETDVSTSFAEVWDHNPHVTPLSEGGAGIDKIDCTYPLINRCNDTPYHCLHGFIEFLNEQLGLSIKPTAFRGDLHLSEQERAWFSQVRELTRQDIPFWIVAAGGKFDVTIKWWQTERYQQVVDHFRGKIQFVQVGEWGHHHPRLEGVIDLRGKTNVRELIRLVYHSEGVLCGVTALMHLAAAVPMRSSPAVNRPCVVVAGGREPAHWEAYPDHQFIHTTGALSCCVRGGCWKDRAVRLRDGDQRDRNDHLCVNIVDKLPRCMDLITAADVIQRVEMYFRGGKLRYLSTPQQSAAKRGVAVSRGNRYDRQPLNLHSAGMACEHFIRTLPRCPDQYRGRGIVICGGGVRYFTNAWVCVNTLKRLNCALPIQLWHLGKHELDERMRALMAPLGVECVDALKLRKRFPARRLGGWEIKPYALLHCPFREVLLLDADNVPVMNPESLFETSQFQGTGAVFWPDYAQGKNEKNAVIWRSCGVRQPAEPEFETGQILLDKSRCWQSLRLCLWFNEHSDFYYQYLHGDKETFHLAFRKLKTPYSFVPHPIQTLPGTMCQHDFKGRRIFQHRNTDKWDLFLRNKTVNGFRFEEECRSDVKRLQRLWDGGMGSLESRWIPRPARRRLGKPRLEAVILSSPSREAIRLRTLKNLSGTDWQAAPIHVQEVECSPADDMVKRQTLGAYLALQQFLERNADYFLLLDDNLEFNRHLHYNLQNWTPIKTRQAAVASVFNPAVRELACDLKTNARIVSPQQVAGSQAYLISRSAAKGLVRHWQRVDGSHHRRIPRLVARLGQPILYHAPSLVQNMEPLDSADPRTLKAMDFDANWMATL
jgi:ADP-heptose:LPS heptosyltransferase